MSSPLSPRLVRGGIVTMDPDTSAVQSVIALQYNPETLTRTLQIQAVAGKSIQEQRQKRQDQAGMMTLDVRHCGQGGTPDRQRTSYHNRRALRCQPPLT